MNWSANMLQKEILHQFRTLKIFMGCSFDIAIVLDSLAYN